MIGSILRIIAGTAVVAGLVLGLSFVSIQVAEAQTGQEAACEGSGGQWADGRCTTPGDSRTVTGTLRQVANILIFIVGAVAVVMVIIGGLRYALAQGDAAAVGAAKNTVMYAIVGVVIAVASFALVNFVLDALGVK